MTTEDEFVRRMLVQSLSGEGAHADCKAALEGLPWKLAGERANGAPHSIYQLVHHMIYWNEWLLRWLAKQNPAVPEHASGSWPGAVGPEKAEDWSETTARFASVLDEIAARAREGELFWTGVALGAERSALEMIQSIASHNSYHLGQIVLIRQTLGAWPPPKGGGLTW